MTCQECELALAMEQNKVQNVDEHLAVCSACRALAEELRANAAAFESFADDPLPSVRHHVMAQVRSRSAARQVLRWGWAVAAAAAIVVATFLVRSTAPEQTVPPVHVSQVQSRDGQGADAREIPPPPRARRTHRQLVQPLMVKMLTSDPDVVIYWQIESEDGER
jgi:anti-sigma factor RsiW